MSAKVLTAAAAKEAKIELIEDGRGTQAVPRRCRRDAGGASFRLGEHEDEGGSQSFRREAVAAKRHRPRTCWLQVVACLAGGGVVFGPKPRDYSKKVSKTTRRLAFHKALSERIKAGDVLTIDKFRSHRNQDQGVHRISQETDRCAEGPGHFGLVRRQHLQVRAQREAGSTGNGGGREHRAVARL